MADAPDATITDRSSIPQDTVDFAHRMFDAARAGDASLLLQAVDAGLPVNLTNDKGNTFLMLAAYSGHAALTSALLARGADPNRVNDAGQSPLAGAVFKGEDAVVHALVAAGADPRRGTPSAIQTARIFKKTDVLAVLGATDEDLQSEVPQALGRPGVELAVITGDSLKKKDGEAEKKSVG